MEDRYAYERAMLRFMLTTRTRESLPVVWAETLLREFVEDLGAGMQCYEGDPGEIAVWAMGMAREWGASPSAFAATSSKPTGSWSAPFPTGITRIGSACSHHHGSGIPGFRLGTGMGGRWFDDAVVGICGSTPAAPRKRR